MRLVNRRRARPVTTSDLRRFGLVMGIIVSCFLISHGVLAASTRSNFYRTPDSLFASGTEQTDRLRNLIEREFSSLWMKVSNFQTSHSQSIGWVSRKEVVCASDLAADDTWGYALALHATPFYRLPDGRTNMIATFASGERVKILGLVGQWIQTQIDRNHVRTIGFSPARDFVTRLDFAHSVKIKGELEPQNLVRNLTGKVLLHDGTSHAWSQIEHFNADDTLCMARGNQATLRTSPSEQARALTRLAMKSPLKNLGEVDVRWAQVHVPRHGLVWWQSSQVVKRAEPTEADHSRISSTEETTELMAESLERGPLRNGALTTEQLFRRKVARFVRYEYPDAALYLVSAGGLFRSADGHTWYPILGFQDQNYPITITASGWVIAGSYMSTDRAQTFEPFVKWERVLNLVAHLGWPSPKHVGITHVSSHAAPPVNAASSNPENMVNGGRAADSNAGAVTNVLMGLDLGKQRRLTIATADWGQHWTIAPTLAERLPATRSPSAKAPEMHLPSPFEHDHVSPTDHPKSDLKWRWVSKPATALTDL